MLGMEHSRNTADEASRYPIHTKNEPSIEDDKRLVQRVLAGDEAAFTALYDAYAPMLLRRILRLMGRDDQAEDCLQMVFIEVLERLEHYRGEGALGAWLHRITTTTVLQQFRKQKSRSRLAEGFAFFSMFREEANPLLAERLLFDEERKKMLYTCLEDIEADRRMAILLCDIEGKPVEDAAKELHIPLGTLASRLHRGRQDLQKSLSRRLKQHGLSVEEWFHG